MRQAPPLLKEGLITYILLFIFCKTMTILATFKPYSLNKANKSASNFPVDLHSLGIVVSTTSFLK